MISTQEERDKYRRTWAVPIYRSSSPGERLVSHFINNIDWRQGDTLIDVGCGTGRAAAALNKHGFNVMALDICAESLDNSVRKSGLPFIEACLWEPLPFHYQFDWFYCTDVMEHIPPEHVDAVLDNLQKIAKGGFFQIAMFPHEINPGDPLHLTLEDKDWWEEKLRSRWEVTDLGEVEYQRLCEIVRK